MERRRGGTRVSEKVKPDSHARDSSSDHVVVEAAVAEEGNDMWRNQHFVIETTEMLSREAAEASGGVVRLLFSGCTLCVSRWRCPNLIIKELLTVKD